MVVKAEAMMVEEVQPVVHAEALVLMAASVVSTVAGVRRAAVRSICQRRPDCALYQCLHQEGTGFQKRRCLIREASPTAHVPAV